MKIALLARNANLYTHTRFVEAAEARGHEIDVIDTLRVYLNVASHRPQIRYRGEILRDYDAVIPRIGASVTFFGTAILRQFEIMGVYPLNESVAITRSRDKLRSLQLLARKGIGLPVTIFAHSTSQADDILEMLGGAPVVIKLLEGTQGIGVVLGETDGSAKSMIQAFGGLKANILVQEFIKEAGNEDIRCLVVGDRGRRVDGTQGRQGRFPLQPPSRRVRATHQDHAGRAFNGGPRRERHRAECVRCGHPPLEPWASGDGGEFQSGPGGRGESNRHRRRRQDHRIHREERAAEQDQDAGEGIAIPDRNALPLHPASTDFAPLTSPAVSVTPRRRRLQQARAPRR